MLDLFPTLNIFLPGLFRSISTSCDMLISGNIAYIPGLSALKNLTRYEFPARDPGEPGQPELHEGRLDGGLGGLVVCQHHEAADSPY